MLEDTFLSTSPPPLTVCLFTQSKRMLPNDVSFLQGYFVVFLKVKHNFFSFLQIILFFLLIPTVSATPTPSRLAYLNEMLVCLGGGLLFVLSLRNPPVDLHNSKRSGKDFYKELMKSRNPTRFQNCLRMTKTTFKKLLRVLKLQGKLRRSKTMVTVTGRKISICAGEKLAIFLYVLAGASNSQADESWQHSSSTIS